MEIREARVSDAEAISDVLEELIAAGRRTKPGHADFALSHYIRHPDRLHCFVAVGENGRILGLQSLKFAREGNAYGTPTGWGIIGTHVRPSAARMGIGSRLFSATLAGARQAKLPAIEAYIGEENSAALDYYEALGFRAPFGRSHLQGISAEGMNRVLIIGGYGNFGSYIARELAADPNIALLIGGRSKSKGDAFAASLDGVNPAAGCALDVDGDIEKRLREIRPDIVIHTSGPFQSQNHRVARAAIATGAHYLDLADARHFVATIGELDKEAKAAGVAVIAGASSVPCLTAAFIDRYKPHFARLESAVYGIAAAQATNRGLGTAAAILSYVGKSFAILSNGKRKRVFGWQGLHAVRYPELGTRLFGFCDIPDLDLFPPRYPDLQELRFVAGHEVKLLHIGTWLLSWAVRLGIVRSLSPYAEQLLRLSLLFDPLGSDKSGFHMFLTGVDHHGRALEIRIFMVARQVHGPFIPCVPAILLAKRIAAAEDIPPGARPCLDLVMLDEIMSAIAHLDIDTIVTGPNLDERWLASPR